MFDQKRRTIIMALGSNHNTKANIEKARILLRELFPDDLTFSEEMKTEPVDSDGPHYVNLIAVAQSSLRLPEIRKALSHIERLCGNTAEKRNNGMVEMDIDILRWGNKRYHLADWERSYIKELLATLELPKKFLVLMLTLVTLTLGAQDFNTHFTDQTLRLDYIFAGDADTQAIYLDEMHTSPRWFGKRARLKEVPVQGNGQIIVRSHNSTDTIYRNSFSTLFQEWLSYDEAKSQKRSFQNVFLIPMPRHAVDITVQLYNNRRETCAELTHTVDPSDILIRKHPCQAVTPYQTVQQAADTSRCIRVAFVAEGYRQDEMQTFLRDTQDAVEALFSHEPFKRLRSRFNIVAVKALSEDSGTSIPSQGIWKNTALNSHFDTFYSERYLTTLQLKQLHDCLTGIPYEHIIILVNTDNYGGGGILNSYNLAAAHHPQFKPVVVHEFGHSFAGLADEYAYEGEQIPMYPTDVEPWEPNITTNVDFSGKWENLISKGTPLPTPEEARYKKAVGLFEGAGYSLKGVFRPMQDCRMKTNSEPEFCTVCQKAIERLIDFYTE